MERKTRTHAPSSAASSLALADLLEGFRRRCPIASAELTWRFGPALMRYCRRRLAEHPIRTAARAEDVLQEMWLEVFKSLMTPHTFADEAAFVVYLHRIADGVASRHERASHAAKRSGHREETLDLALHDQAGSEPDPAEAAAFADELGHVLAALEPKHGALVEALRAGESLPEAATRLGLRERTARHWIEGLRETLRARREAQ